MRDPTIMFIHTHYYQLWSLIFLAALLIGGWQFCLFFIMQPIGWNLFHGALVNYFNHTPCIGSYRNYNSEDTSYNNKFIHWFLLGEGLHNNHHSRPYDISQAHTPGEFDPAAWVINKFLK